MTTRIGPIVLLAGLALACSKEANTPPPVLNTEPAKAEANTTTEMPAMRMRPAGAQTDQLAAGVLDPTFGVGGKVTGAIGASSNAAQAIALQPDGRILISGYALSVSQDSFVARFGSDGTLDPTYGTIRIDTPLNKALHDGRLD